MGKAIEEKKLRVLIKALFENSIYIRNLFVQTKTMIITKENLPPPTCTPFTVFLIAEKLLSLRL